MGLQKIKSKKWEVGSNEAENDEEGKREVFLKKQSYTN
jgi:hypothetical protein